MGLCSFGTIDILCLMVFWGQIQNYMMRSNLSLLIVAMINPEFLKQSKLQSNSTSSNINDTTPTICDIEKEIGKPQELLLIQKFVRRMKGRKCKIVIGQIFEKAANLGL